VAEEARPSRQAATLLGLLFLATYAYFVSPPAWNESSRFDLVRSLVERQRLDIDPYHQDTGDKAFFRGHYFSDKAPGTALVAAPVYAAYYGFLRLGGGSTPASIPAVERDAQGEQQVLVNPAFRHALYICSLFTSALGGALLGVLFWTFLRDRLALTGPLALQGTLALALGSMVFPYATMFYGHVLAALFLFAAFALVDQDPRRLAGAGALAGMAVLTELPTAPAALLIAGLALWRARRRGLWFAAGLAGPLLVLAAYQWAAFGSVFGSGYAHVSDPEFAAGMSHGLMGVGVPRPGVLVAMLVGRARGLLYVSPVLVLGFVGLGRKLADRRDRALFVVAAAIVLYFLLMNAGYYMWYGGQAIGPRHFIPALPFLCLGLPYAFRRPRPLVVGLLLGVSMLNLLVATAVEPAAPMVGDVLRDHVYRHLLRGELPLVTGPSNLGRMFGLPGPLSLLPLLVVWGLALPLLPPLLSDRSEGPIIAAHPGDADHPA
jgi:hypothetical protein